MKKVLIFISVLILISCTNQKEGIVTSKSGLILREYPNVNAKKIDSVAFNEKVIILSTNGPEETIDNIKSNWYNIKYKSKSGWVFAGYLNTPLQKLNKSEIVKEMPELWSMITEAGYGYSLKFNNSNQTCELKYWSEGTRLSNDKILGKFTVSDDETVTLIFNDFEVNFYSKIPKNYISASQKDKITEEEKNKFNFANLIDNDGYVTKKVLITKNYKIITKDTKMPGYFEDLKSCTFQLLD